MKKQIPKISAKTGFSEDYGNEFTRFSYIDPQMTKREERFARMNSENPMRKYTERYSPEEYEGVVTDANRNSLTRLDEIVDEVNLMVKPESINWERAKFLWDEARKLVYGN